jgi:hypothetical protein
MADQIDPLEKFKASIRALRIISEAFDELLKEAEAVQKKVDEANRYLREKKEELKKGE